MFVRCQEQLLLQSSAFGRCLEQLLELALHSDLQVSGAVAFALCTVFDRCQEQLLDRCLEQLLTLYSALQVSGAVA